MVEKRKPAVGAAKKVEEVVAAVAAPAPVAEPVQEQVAAPVKKVVKKVKQAVHTAAQPEKVAARVEVVVGNVAKTNGDGLMDEIKATVQDVAEQVEKMPVTKQVIGAAKNVAGELEKHSMTSKVMEQMKSTADQIENSRIAADMRKAAADARTTIEKSPLTAALHRVLLASIGAVALAQEEIEDLINRLVERGQIAEADGKRMLKDVLEQRKQAMDKAQAVAADVVEVPKRVADDVEQRVEGVLTKMNIPSKDEIEALSAKITALTKKVDELKKPQ